MLHQRNNPVGDKCAEKQAIMQIADMTCASCVSRVEAAIRGVSGVSSVTVKLSGGKVIVTYDPSNISVRDLTAAVRSAGYSVVMEKITMPVAGMMCASCVRHVESALLGQDGIFSATASLKTGRVTVTYNPAQVSPGEIGHVIETAGYQVTMPALKNERTVKAI